MSLPQENLLIVRNTGSAAVKAQRLGTHMVYGLLVVSTVASLSSTPSAPTSRPGRPAQTASKGIDASEGIFAWVGGTTSTAPVSILDSREYNGVKEAVNTGVLSMRETDVKKVGTFLLVSIAVVVFLVSITSKTKIFSPVGSTAIIILSLLGAYAFGKDDGSPKGRS